MISTLAAVAALAGIGGIGTPRGSSATGLAAGDRMIASCGSGMTFAYRTAIDAIDASYAVSNIELSHVPAGCQGERLAATFYDSSGAPIGSPVEATLTSAGATQSIAIVLGSNDIDARHVRGFSVVIS